MGPLTSVRARKKGDSLAGALRADMEFSAENSLILLGLLAAAAALLAMAQLVRVPYPILLVLGGLGLGLVPGMPRIELPPDLVLVAVLPPLLYGSAFFTSLRELRANIRPITLLAVGLVLMTMLVVAAVAHALIPGLSWPTAFVLGAIVSPTGPNRGRRRSRNGSAFRAGSSRSSRARASSTTAPHSSRTALPSPRSSLAVSRS